jgi:hypothetical protein
MATEKFTTCLLFDNVRTCASFVTLPMMFMISTFFNELFFFWNFIYSAMRGGAVLFHHFRF